MTKLQRKGSEYPFWGTNVNLITGLDPLGLQVTSEASYATMLTGISNLTNRIRYYGFYCWLVDLYFKTEIKGNQTEQNRFIRRSELLLAIMMQSERNHVTQVTGSNFANALVVKKPETYDLKAGADKDSDSKDLYWQYDSGAFGQYYFGALQALNLIVRFENEEGDTLFNITQPNPRQKVSGRQLADAFDELIPNKIRTLFLETVKNGVLKQDATAVFVKYFAIDLINPDSTEWQLYVDLLLDKDFPNIAAEEAFSFHRKETILSLLSIAQSEQQLYDWQHYISSCYEQKFTNSNETSIGWYSYKLNEYWQYACGLIFFGILSYLKSLNSDVYLPNLIEDFTELTVVELKAENDIQLKDFIIKLTDNENSIIAQRNRNNKPQVNAKIGFELLLKVYNDNVEHLHQLGEYIAKKGIKRDGNMVDGLSAISNYSEDTLSDFIKSFLHSKIIYRHQYVALRKMGNGIKATNKFIIDDQMIRLIDVFDAYWTSPRMNALQYMLTDLQIVDSNKKITELYSKLNY